jgi:hypothetical protein
VTQHQKFARKIKSDSSHSKKLQLLMDWEKRFEARRFGAGKINVARESRVIVRIRLPAVRGIILLAVGTKMHSEHGNTIGACHGIESSRAFVGLTFDDSCDL